MSVESRRKPKFHWQAPDEIEHIRWEWGASSPSAAVGLGVYRALTELATEGKARTNIGGGTDSDPFRVTQKELAARAVISDRSAARACDELVRIGLLSIETDHDGENRPGRPSFYTLLDAPATYERSSDGEVTQRTNGVQTTSEAISDVPEKGTNSVRTPPHKGKKEQQRREEGVGGPSSVAESAKATAAWTEAKQLLAVRLPGERFDSQIAPLEVAGERDGHLVLVDSSELGGGEWIAEARPLILEVLAGFDDFEILDETDLGRAGHATANTASVDPLGTAPTHIREAAPTVLAALTRISEVKRCPFPPQDRVVTAMATYPAVDHLAVAGDMEDRLLAGTWKGREVTDVVAVYRSFLKVEQQSAGERPRRRQRGEEHPADARIREIRERRAAGVIDSDAEEER